MTADPEPSDLIIFQKSESTVAESHADGVDGVAVVDVLELETRVPGIVAKQTVGLPCEVLDLRWQLAIRRPEARRRTGYHSFSGSSSVVRPAAWSARASAASFFRASWELVNWWFQCSSSRSSSSNQRAIRSCSSGGSIASCAMAASSIWVTRRVYRMSTRRCAGERDRAGSFRGRDHDPVVTDAVGSERERPRVRDAPW